MYVHACKLLDSVAHRHGDLTDQSGSPATDALADSVDPIEPLTSCRRLATRCLSAPPSATWLVQVLPELGISPSPQVSAAVGRPGDIAGPHTSGSGIPPTTTQRSSAGYAADVADLTTRGIKADMGRRPGAYAGPGLYRVVPPTSTGAFAGGVRRFASVTCTAAGHLACGTRRRCVVGDHHPADSRTATATRSRCGCGLWMSRLGDRRAGAFHRVPSTYKMIWTPRLHQPPVTRAREIGIGRPAPSTPETFTMPWVAAPHVPRAPGNGDRSRLVFDATLRPHRGRPRQACGYQILRTRTGRTQGQRRHFAVSRM